MDSYEVAARLRLIPKLSDVYLVSLFDSARFQGPTVENVRFDVYLVKPLNYDMLVSVINRYFSLKV